MVCYKLHSRVHFLFAKGGPRVLVLSTCMARKQMFPILQSPSLARSIGQDLYAATRPDLSYRTTASETATEQQRTPDLSMHTACRQRSIYPIPISSMLQQSIPRYRHSIPVPVSSDTSYAATVTGYLLDAAYTFKLLLNSSQLKFPPFTLDAKSSFVGVDGITNTLLSENTPAAVDVTKTFGVGADDCTVTAKLSTPSHWTAKESSGSTTIAVSGSAER